MPPPVRYALRDLRVTEPEDLDEYRAATRAAVELANRAQAIVNLTAGDHDPIVIPRALLHDLQAAHNLFVKDAGGLLVEVPADEQVVRRMPGILDQRRDRGPDAA